MRPTREEIVAHIEAFLAARGVDGPASVVESTGLLGQGIGLDSVEALQMVARMEESFDLTIADEDLDAAHFRTVGSFVRFIEQRLPR